MDDVVGTARHLVNKHGPIMALFVARDFKNKSLVSSSKIFWQDVIDEIVLSDAHGASLLAATTPFKRAEVV